MRHRQQFLIHMTLCLMMIVALVGTLLPATAAAQDSENLLENGGFEGTYVAVGSDPALQLAPNWEPWSLPPPEDAESSAVNLRPDYQPAPANRVRSGNAAQEYNTFFATHDGGVYQRVPVSLGAELTFSAYIYVWSSATFENPDQSTQPQSVTVQVGIDPTGGTDGASENITWSDPQEYYDEYQEQTVSATAEANAVTVFVRSTPQGAIGVNNIYVDDASLIQTGQSDDLPVPTEETAEPSETSTAEASETSTAEASETSTAEASETSTAEASTTATTATSSATATESDALSQFPNRLTYTVQPGDTVVGLALRFSSTVEAITVANGLNDAGFILVGQTLVIPVPAGQGEPASSGTATATATAAATQAPSNTGTHVVQLGETLYGIAQRYNTTVEALATLNNIVNPNQISAGTILQVPTTGGNAPPQGGPTTGGTLTHVVRLGENAFRIGLRYNITVERLALANGLVNPNLIYAGQVLVIPR